MKISRNIVGPDGARRKEDKVLTIGVKPGWKAGTKITFPREGDQTTGKIPADIVFIIRDKPHALFKRENADIKYTAKISLRDVSLCFLHLEFIIEAIVVLPYAICNLIISYFKPRRQIIILLAILESQVQ